MVTGQMVHQSEEDGKEVVEGAWQQAGMAAGQAHGVQREAGLGQLIELNIAAEDIRAGGRETQRACQMKTSMLYLLGQ